MDRLNPRPLFKHQHVAAVPARWAAQYPRGRYPDKDQTTDALNALAKGTFIAADIDRIIGNDSWTAHRCDGCGADRDILIRIGEEPDYDARWLDLCTECIVSMAQVMYAAMAGSSGGVNTAHNKKIGVE